MKAYKERKKDFSELEFLFHQFNVNYTNEDEDEEIFSFNINDKNELSTLFSLYIKKRFLSLPEKERFNLINILKKYIANSHEKFDDLFSMADPIFLSEIENYRSYMEVLLINIEDYHCNA